MSGQKYILSSFAFSTRRSQTARLKKLSLQDQPFEEERVPDYDPHAFCDVAPGDVVGNGRYEILSKLGWGSTSTVWLGRDRHWWRWRSPLYVSIKFNNCDADEQAIQREVDLLQRLSTADSSDPGFGLVRKPLNDFRFATQHGKHLCLVYEPLRETLEIYQRRLPNHYFPLPLLKLYVKILLTGLNYLHDKCNIVHTDLKLDNFLIGFEEHSVLKEYVQRVHHSEILFKESPDRRVFQSCSNFGSMKSLGVVPFITDFGLAQNLSGRHQNPSVHPIQSDVYRAPEVLLGWGWSYSVDIWNMGALIWNMACNHDLFTPLHPVDRIYDASTHVAQMIALLGPPSPELIKRQSETSWKWTPAVTNTRGELCNDSCSFYNGPFFDSSTGYFLYPEQIPSHRSLDDQAIFVEGREKDLFIDFITQMLRWDPAERENAGNLLNHPWLMV